MQLTIYGGGAVAPLPIRYKIERYEAMTAYIYESRASVTTMIKCDDGRLTKVLEYENKVRVEIPITSTGEVRWFDDSVLLRQ